MNHTMLMHNTTEPKMTTLTREQVDADFQRILIDEFGSVEEFEAAWNKQINDLEALDRLSAEEFSPYSTINS